MTAPPNRQNGRAGDLAARRRLRRQAAQVDRADRTTSTRPAAGRADGRLRAAPAAVRRGDPGARPPRGVAAPRYADGWTATPSCSPRTVPPTAGAVAFSGAPVPAGLPTSDRRHRAAAVRGVAGPDDRGPGGEPVAVGAERVRLEGTDPAVDAGLTPGWPRALATSSCRRGRRAGTEQPSAAPCTACCRRSISPPARASTPPWPHSASRRAWSTSPRWWPRWSGRRSRPRSSDVPRSATTGARRTSARSATTARSSKASST